MDKYITTINNFKFHSIAANSLWWNEIIKFGNIVDKEFVPPLSERMLIEDYFQAFRNDKGFTVLAEVDNEFVGCLCNFYQHPETNKPWYQCIIINEKFRQNKLAKIFYELSDEILRQNGDYFVQGRTWIQNFKNRNALKSAGFYYHQAKINDRGEGIHTLVFEKCLVTTDNFEGISSLGILGGMGCNASAKFNLDICFLNSQIENEQHQLPIFLHSATNTPDRTTLLLENKNNELAKILENQIVSLLQFPVTHIIICCFTYHAVLKNIPTHLRNKIVSIVDYANELLKNKKGNYLVLCTNGTSFFQLIEPKDNLFYPNPADQNLIHEQIYKLKIGEPARLVLIEIENIINTYDCTGIVIACTDLYTISEDLEIHFKHLDIINPLKVMSYDVVDNWKKSI